jgi:hypothetical protein
MKKFIVSLMLVFGFCTVSMPSTTPVNAMVYISDQLQLDESSAVVLIETPTNYKKFAICANINGQYETIIFTFSPKYYDNRYVGLSEKKFRYSLDGGDTFYTGTASLDSVIGKAFRSAWYYAFGGSFS